MCKIHHFTNTPIRPHKVGAALEYLERFNLLCYDALIEDDDR